MTSRTADGELQRSRIERPRPVGVPAPDGPSRWRQPALVSVILPARDAADTIGAQLEALAGQCYRGNWELLVIDDGSRDGTSDAAMHAAAQLGVELRLQRNHCRMGSSSARNAAARTARGDLLAFCDADDIVSPLWLAELVAAAGCADQVAGFVDSHSLEPGQRLSRGLPADRPPAAGTLPYAGAGNMAIWAEVFATAGGFDERHRRNADVEFSVRLRRPGAETTLESAPKAKRLPRSALPIRVSVRPSSFLWRPDGRLAARGVRPPLHVRQGPRFGWREPRADAMADIAVSLIRAVLPARRARSGPASVTALRSAFCDR